MNMRGVFVTVFLAFVIGCVAAGSVVDLTSDNFESHITSHDLTLVEFYAPWCGHCKALAPEYDEAASRLDGTYFAKVDCTKESALCGEYGVRGYPTLYLIQKDKTKYSYEDARKADALVKFVNKYRLPAFVEIEESGVKDFLGDAKEGSNTIKVVLSADSDAAVETFKALSASRRDDGEFAIVKGAKASKAEIYRDGKLVATQTGADADAIKKVLTVEKFPPVGEIGPDNYAKYAERNLPLVWIFIPYDKTDVATSVPNALVSVAEKYREKYLFVKLDSNRWGDHGKSFGVTTFPGVAVEIREGRKNYVFPTDKEINSENFGAFLEDVEAGKVAPNVRSEPIPASNDGPVTVVVGKTWEQIVMDTTKDVFIEFYAPWCGHCKALAPKYEQLGEEFKSVDSVVIAKIDGTENDTPVDVAGFPTIYLYPANRKGSPLQYSGARTVEDMAKFIRENGDTTKNAGEAASGRTEL